jgi:amino acid adenylation domain-containing protein
MSAGPPSLTSCVHERIAGQASAFPDRLAIQEGDRRVVFGELDRRAGDLAQRILAQGVNRDRPVGILLPASIDLIAAELAILKAGAAFLPIDPSYPLERVAFILSDAAIEVVLTNRATAGRISIPGLKAIYVDDDDVVGAGLLPAPDPAALAYVIFTSGSTGKPKGVMVEHRNLMNLVDHFQSSLGLSADDRSSVTSSPAFDASIAEIWPYLAIGASVHIAPPGLKLDSALLLKWIKREKITVSLLPTSLVEIALERELPELPDLRVLITGGEQLHKVPPIRLPFRFLNAYGPTECTVIASWAEMEPEPDARRPPSIGRAISGAFIRVMDEQLRPLSEGMPGEIYIGGAGVARGYLNHPELTEARFIADPLDPTGSGRLYRTGDRGCWRRQGELAFLGRTDRQMQLRGFRIEPDEIEFVLKQHESIDDAAVMLQRDSQIARLVAFLAASEPAGEGLLPEIRERVSRGLPAHMHPAIYVVLKQFPMTVHGKIDYSQLPLPARPLEAAVFDDAGQTVRAVWHSMLGIGELPDAANFFEAGGDSLALMKMLGELEKRLGVHLQTAAFLRSPTLGHCIDLLRGGGNSELPACVIAMSSASDSGAPFFFANGAGGGVHRLAALARASALQRPFYALESQALPDDMRATFSIQETARYFLSAIREVQPAGPYLLGGYSLGGLVAIEMAHALLDHGESVRPIVLVDTYAEAAEPSKAERLRLLLNRLATAPLGDSKAFVTDRLLRRFRSRAERSREYAEIELDKGNEVDAAVNYMRRDLRPCRVPLRIVVSRYGSRLAPRAPDRGWSRFAGAGFEICEIAGDHFSIVQEPHVGALGAQLKQFVDG